MPVLSTFYGIRIMMYAHDNRKHYLPHIHVQYQDDKAVIEIPTGNLLAGDLPSKKLRMVQTWVDIHQEDLMRCWELAVNGAEPGTVDPLR